MNENELRSSSYRSRGRFSRRSFLGTLGVYAAGIATGAGAVGLFLGTESAKADSVDARVAASPLPVRRESPSPVPVRIAEPVLGRRSEANDPNQWNVENSKITPTPTITYQREVTIERTLVPSNPGEASKIDVDKITIDCTKISGDDLMKEWCFTGK